MKILIRVSLLAVVLLSVVALPAAADICSCQQKCCPSRATCTTACCLPGGGWTTCGDYGMPGCGGIEGEPHAAGGELDGLFVEPMTIDEPVEAPLELPLPVPPAAAGS